MQMQTSMPGVYFTKFWMCVHEKDLGADKVCINAPILYQEVIYFFIFEMFADVFENDGGHKSRLQVSYIVIYGVRVHGFLHHFIYLKK